MGAKPYNKKFASATAGGAYPLGKKGHHHVPYLGHTTIVALLLLRETGGRGGMTWGGSKTIQQKIRERYRKGPTPLVKKDTIMYRTWDTPQSLHCYYGTTGEGWPGWPDVGWEQNHTTKNSRALPRGGPTPLVKKDTIMYRTWDTPQSLHCYYYGRRVAGAA